MFGYEVSISFEDILITIVVPYASNFYCYSMIFLVLTLVTIKVVSGNCFAGVRGLKSHGEVESLREKVYATLEEYTRLTHPEEPGRFAKLLLRLPALRSISLKCLEHLFFYQLIGDAPIDTFLMEMLESPSDPRLD